MKLINLSVRAKLILSFGAMWLMLALLVFTAHRNITALAQSEKELHDIHFEEAIQLQQLSSHQNYNRGQILDMLLTTKRSDWEAHVKNIEGRAHLIDAIVERLLKLDPDPLFQSKLQELKNTVVAYRQTREQEIGLIYQGKVEEARQLGLGVGEEGFDKIRSLATELGDKASKETDQQLDQDRQAAQWAVRLFAAVGVVALLLAGVMVVLFNRVISSSIADLTAGIALLGSSASEILAATTQVASGTAETATAISETTTTVEEVRQAAQYASGKAKNVSDSAQRVAQVSQTGQKAVEETATGMGRIREQMETIAETIVRLSEQSQSIGGIIASVTDIADRSNLLAVNAAIEAARAGEQGKAFAVVAQEIKSLAEQSKQATTQVRGILSDVQKATSAAVMATEQGTKAVEAGVKQSAQAGEAIRLLAETTGEAVQAATQIVASSQQQVVGMDQIGAAMTNINQAGAETAASMRQAEASAQNLHELGQKLKELVGRFKA